MRLVSDIAKRFNQPKYLPRSLVVMRVVAMAGIAIGAATLVVALSIVSGFQREYRRSILDFNAHVVVLKAGEMSDTTEIDDFISKLKKSPDESRFANRYDWLFPVTSVLKNLYESAERLHDDIAYEHENRPSFVEFWENFNPRRIKSVLPAFLKKIYKIRQKGVVGITPFIYREGLAISNGTIKGIVVKGVDPQTIRDVNQMRIDAGVPLNEALASAKKPGVILGKPLAQYLGNPKNINLMVPSSEREKQFINVAVVGTFESGLYDYDSQFALMNIEDARRIFETGSVKATGIEIKLDDPNKADTIAYAVNDSLPASYQAITWGELNRDLFEALSLEKTVFSIIMGILVIVASFNIIGVLVLLICYRAHEVAILKALGVQTAVLQKIFTRGGFKTGLFGTIIGIALGIGLSTAIKHLHLIKLEPEIYFVTTLPIDISWPICGIVGLFSVLMCWGTSKIAAKRLTLLPIIGNL